MVVTRDGTGPAGEAMEHKLVLERGRLCDPHSRAELPGQRAFTVAEYIGRRIHRQHRWGEWILVLHEYTEADAPFRQWCIRNCHDEIADGFRFHPLTWDLRCGDELGIVFLPEFDDPRSSVRAMASFERECRSHRIWLNEAEQRRNQCLRNATRVGLTRRQAAAMLEMSVGRIQGLVAGDGGRGGPTSGANRWT